jgi:hypothetical protein
MTQAIQGIVNYRGDLLATRIGFNRVLLRFGSDAGIGWILFTWSLPGAMDLQHRAFTHLVLHCFFNSCSMVLLG